MQAKTNKKVKEGSESELSEEDAKPQKGRKAAAKPTVGPPFIAMADGLPADFPGQEGKEGEA